MSFSEKIKSGKFVVTVECNPPIGDDIASMYSDIEEWKNLVDAINVTDCPMAKVRISSIVACFLIQSKFRIETIFNFTCRDRNLIALQSELLGAHAIKVQNVLAITGDPPSHGDCPEAKAVFDVDSAGLIKLAKKLSVGESHQNEFLVGTTVCLDPENKEKEKEKLKRKLEAGADFVITQPFYEMSVWEKAKEWIADIKVPFIAGVLPLKSFKMAKYLDEKVPGINVPKRILEELSQMEDLKEMKEYGLQLTEKLIFDIKKSFQGIHLMPMGSKGVVSRIVESW